MAQQHVEESILLLVLVLDIKHLLHEHFLLDILTVDYGAPGAGRLPDQGKYLISKNLIVTFSFSADLVISPASFLLFINFRKLIKQLKQQAICAWLTYFVFL